MDKENVNAIHVVFMASLLFIFMTFMGIQIRVGVPCTLCSTWRLFRDMRLEETNVYFYILHEDATTYSKMHHKLIRYLTYKVLCKQVQE